jgi:hypothetical protein
MGNMVESSDKVADETTTKKQPTALQRAAAAVDHGIAAGTAKVATWVSTKPWTTIALALFISALCTLGFMNIKSEDQPDKLFVPDNSRAFRDRRWVESRFPNDASVSTMILDHKNGRNLLDKEALLEVFDVYDRVLATSSDGGNRGYDQRSCAVNTRNPAQPCFDAASCYRVDGVASIRHRRDNVYTHRPEVRHLSVLGLGPRDARSGHGHHRDDQPRRRARLLQWRRAVRRARPERREDF